MDRKIKKLEVKEKQLLKGTKALLKEDKKHDKIIEKAKRKQGYVKLLYILIKEGMPWDKRQKHLLLISLLV